MPEKEICKNTKSWHLSRELRRRILRGEWSHGARLDSIRTLSAQYGVGRQVVLSAFQILIGEGLIKSSPGSGTYVNPEPDAKKRCTIAYVIIGDSLGNIFYNSVYQGMLCAAAGTDNKVSSYENEKPKNLYNIDADCIVLTGTVTESVLTEIRKTGKKYIILGNYMLSENGNSVRISMRAAVESILATDEHHRKSVGLITDSPSMSTTREMIEAAEMYSGKYLLPWGVENVACARTPYGTEAVEQVWGTKRDWPERLVMTFHLYLGFAQYLLEHHVPEEKRPEILVMLGDPSFLPLPYPNLKAKAFNLRDRECGEQLIGVINDLSDGKLKAGFTGEYNPATALLQIKNG